MVFDCLPLWAGGRRISKVGLPCDYELKCIFETSLGLCQVKLLQQVGLCLYC